MQWLMCESIPVVRRKEEHLTCEIKTKSEYDIQKALDYERQGRLLFMEFVIYGSNQNNSDTQTPKQKQG